MLITIKHRITGSIIISGEYESIKDCVVKNGGAYLGGAYLTGAYLTGVYLTGAYLTGTSLECADLRGADLRGAYLGCTDLRGADLRGADLRGAYLGCADLRGADLGCADLRGADLRGTYLGGAKQYVDSHDVFSEAVRRQRVEIFTEAEWVAIAQITIHRICWDSIQKRFGNVMGGIFQKLSYVGFTEWLEHWNKLTKV